MGISIETLVAAKKFTSETVLGGGAVVGKNVTISSITSIDGGNRITFSYTLDNGTVKTSTLDVMDGKDGKNGSNGAKGAKGDPGINGSDGIDGIGITSVKKTKTEGLVDTYTITFSDGSTFEYEITNGKSGSDGKSGKDGKDAISPTITENADNTDKIYKLDVTTADGTFTTPNLRGKDGSGSSSGEENVIESIKVNGVAQSIAEDKSVDITVPTVDVDKNYVDTELIKKANISDIPSLDGYVTEEELNAKGYLTSHQDISGKVDKVKGKSLIADTEIERLKSVKNYDDTEIKTELAKKANSTDVTKEISDKIAEVVSDAPESFDTLKEISDWISGHENDASAMNSAIKDNKSAIATLQTDKADKTEIPTTPTNVSEFTNDAGYLTEHQDISNLVVKEEGKGLSSNDYTSEEKNKLGGIGTSQGRNIIPYPYSQTTRTAYGVTFTDNKDGSICISGTQDGSTSRPYMGIGIWWNETDKKTSNIPISANTDFTISANCDSNNAGLRYYIYDESGAKLADNVVYGTTIKTLKFDVDTWVALCIETAANGETYDCVCSPQLELGTIAHTYEPTTESNVNLKKSIETKASELESAFTELKNKVIIKTIDDIQLTTLNAPKSDEITSNGHTIHYMVKNGICYMSVLNIGFKTATDTIFNIGSIPKPTNNCFWFPLVGVQDSSYSVLIHPTLDGKLEHHVNNTSMIYSGSFSYPVAES